MDIQVHFREGEEMYLPLPLSPKIKIVMLVS